MVGTIRYNNGVRSNSVTPAVAGVEQERAILRCMSVETVDARILHHVMFRLRSYVYISGN